MGQVFLMLYNVHSKCLNLKFCSKVNFKENFPLISLSKEKFFEKRNQIGENSNSKKTKLSFKSNS